MTYGDTQHIEVTGDIVQKRIILVRQDGSRAELEAERVQHRMARFGTDSLCVYDSAPAPLGHHRSTGGTPADTRCTPWPSLVKGEECATDVGTSAHPFQARLRLCISALPGLALVLARQRELKLRAAGGGGRTARCRSGILGFDDGLSEGSGGH